METKLIRVLLVEDNPGDARLIRRMLANLEPGSSGPHYDAAWTDQLVTGLSHLAQQPVDIVLLDLSLPDSQGLDTVLRVQEAAPDLPIVVLTGLDDEALALQAMHAGAQDYLIKGHVDEHLLTRSIRYAMERKQMGEALRRYSIDLEARNADLDAFAHTVAHDLKNPVAAITGCAQLLMLYQATMSPGEVSEFITDIFHAGHKMNNIIQELMLFSQVRSREVACSALDMLAIVTDARARLTQMSEEYAGEVSLRQEDLWPPALGYAPWLEEVWVNYISNGLKYGGRPPHIEIGADLVQDGQVRYWVRDNGPGIALEEQAQLFVEFSRLEQVRAKGHGLGLSIVKRIVTKLNGQVGVESQPGNGSCFYFTLPAM